MAQPLVLSRRYTPFATQAVADSLPSELLLELHPFEDLQLGGVWTTRRRTITDADLSAYCGVSGDFNPLHIDDEYARGGHFGGRVLPAGRSEEHTSELQSQSNLVCRLLL